MLLAPTAAKAEEPIGSMGNDAALAVLSRPPAAAVQLLQAALRAGHEPADRPDPRGDRDERRHRRRLRAQPARRDARSTRTSSRCRRRSCSTASWRSCATSTARSSRPARSTSRGRSPRARTAWRTALDRVCAEADAALADGVNILILSDRAVSPERAAIPSLLAVAGVHHHLVREGTRLQTGLVLESGEPREVHHFATLIGYGASAINPYLMFESLEQLVAEGRVHGVDDFETAQWNVVKGIAKGLLKTISKMGISTIQSYNGAQIFEAVGLAPELIERHFTGTASRIGGIGMEVLAIETLERHARGFGLATDDLLPVGGVYAWRRDGEHHMWNPETIALLQHAVRHGGKPTYEEYSKLINEDAARRATLRGLLKFRELPEEQWLSDGRRRAGERDRQALRHRRDEPRLAEPRGARDAGDRDEPDRRQVEHRRGRRGPRPLHARPERRPAPLGDQAGRLRPLRREHQLPRQRRRAADQDGPGRQARRGRPAARPQGRPLHRLDPLHDARAWA